MAEKTCELCGYARKPEDLVIHRIIPEEVVKQAGIIDTRTVVLCLNCSHEVQDWYRKKVYSDDYDAGTHRFRPKSSAEMIREYEAAYKAFTAYKKWQRT